MSGGTYILNNEFTFHIYIMGLHIVSADETRADIWYGGYFAFQRFREKVAQYSGLVPSELNTDAAWKGYTGAIMSSPRSNPMTELILCNMFPERAAAKMLVKWVESDDINAIKLRPLMFHSDCDGVWTPRECKKIISLLQMVQANREKQVVKTKKRKRTSPDDAEPIAKKPKTEETDSKEEQEEEYTEQDRDLECIDDMIDGLQYCVDNNVDAKFC
jgi:hypothetical protein